MVGQHYCQAQADFIKEVRRCIDLKPHDFLKDKDWRQINPSGGRFASGLNPTRKLATESFYVRPVAVFVPHLLIPGHVPSCPHCEKSRNVDVSGSCVRWVNTPKILFGIKGHRFLDTKLYFCRTCNKRFTGYDKKSMRLDANQWAGSFPFNLSSKFAVDQDLYSFIVSAGNTTTAALQRQLKQIVTDNYISDYQYYLYLVRVNKILLEKAAVSSQDRRQPRIDFILKPAAKMSLEETEARRDKEIAQRRLDANNWELRSLRIQIQCGLPLRDLLSKKTNRNNLHVSLPGVGVGKIGELLKRGIETAQELLDSEDSFVKSSWRDAVRKHFQTVRKSIRDLEFWQKEFEKSVNDAELMLLEARDAEADNANPTEPAVEEQPSRPPVFSAMDDKKAYSAKFLSSSRIDCILRTEFRHRKCVQDSKMRGIKGRILKLDFNYKIAPKITVWNGPGNCFNPYKCIATIQNEFGLTIWWKGIRCTESISHIKRDLELLNQRLRLNSDNPDTSPVDIIYVDNCCNTYRMLKEVFPNAMIKLDLFHWFKRWDPLLYDKNSKEAGIFRSLMRRAVFVVTQQEMERATTFLRFKKGREPTKDELKKETRSVVPEPTVLEARVNAVLCYVFYTDATTELAGTPTVELTANVPSAKRFFKVMNRDLRGKKDEQLHHVRKGCLSDPTQYYMHFRNRKSGQWFTVRGTSGNEVDNRLLDELTGTRIGIDRADRLLNSFFEISNDRKRVKRLGEADLGTHKTEALAFLNSQAESAGYSPEQLPFPHLSAPPVLSNHPVEFLGLDHKYDYEEVSNPTDLSNQPDSYTPLSDDDLNDLLDGVDFLGDEDEADAALEEIGEIDLDNLEVEPVNIGDEEAADNAEAQEHLANISFDIASPEKSIDTFVRLANQQQWVPFRKVDSTKQANTLDIEEAQLFSSLHVKYDRKATPSKASVGYKHFELEWSLNVADRYRRKMNGDDEDGQPIILINRKSIEQLQAHFDDVEASKRIAGLSDRDSQENSQMHQLCRALKATRETVQQPSGIAAPHITYRHYGGTHFGAPTTANAVIVAGAVTNATQANRRTVAPWQVCPPDHNKAPHPLDNFQQRKWCMHCGYQRRQHLKEESFGARCKRNYCANCGDMEQYHVTDAMGPFCSRIRRDDSPYKLWYSTW